MLPIESLDDVRIASYRCLKDRELAREGGRFIAEGELLVRRLLQSDYQVESLLVAQRRAAEIAPLAPPPVPVYVLPDELVHQVIGFKFHSGVIACGLRRPGPSLDQFMAPRAGRLTLVVCPETSNAENMGALIRITSALGGDAMLLGPRCCDPFFRQSIRVSMGTIFRLPILRSHDLPADLLALRDRWGVELTAAVAHADAQPLAAARHPGRLALLFGNEAQGLDHACLDLCDRRLTIPMHLGADSLNVAVSAAVFLHHLCRSD